MGKSFDKSRSYQGWSTVQTWCIALTIDQTRRHLDRALEQVEYGNGVRPMASELIGEIRAMAPWAWDEGQNFDDDVNWSELREHYERKNEENKRKP